MFIVVYVLCTRRNTKIDKHLKYRCLDWIFLAVLLYLEISEVRTSVVIPEETRVPEGTHDVENTMVVNCSNV